MCHYINRFQYWIVYTCAYRIYSLIGYVLPKRIVPTPKTVGLDSNWPQMNRKRISLPEMLALHIQQDDYQFVCCDRSPDRRIVRYPSYPRLYLARSTTSPTRAQNSVGQTMGGHSSLRNFDINSFHRHRMRKSTKAIKFPFHKFFKIRSFLTSINFVNHMINFC